MPPKPSRRSINAIPKVRVEDARPLPEPVEEPYHEDMLNVLQDGNSKASIPFNRCSSSGSATYKERNLDQDLVFDSADDLSHGHGGHLDDSESSSFGNSVASFMSWSDDVELDATNKVVELMNEVEESLYEKEPTSLLKKEVAAECEEWTKKFPHFRLKGVNIPRESFELQRAYVLLQSESKSTSEEKSHSGEETTEEIIAVHGLYGEREDDDDDWFSTDVTHSSTPEEPAVLNTELKEKVKNAVLDQLFNALWSKVTRVSPPNSGCSQKLSDKGSASSWRRSSARSTSDQNVVGPKVPHVLVPILKHKSNIPDSDIHGILQVSSKPIRQSARRASAHPRMVPSFDSSLDVEEENIVSLPAHLTSLTLSPKSQYHSQVYTLPQTLSLQGKNHPLTPVQRGYHSAADRRTRKALNRKNKGLKPLEERHMVSEVEGNAVDVRQVSAPNSPRNWNKHITLPPIENVELSLKGRGSSCILAARESKARFNELNPKHNTSTRNKICLSPKSRQVGSVNMQGSESSNIEVAKELFEFHPGFSLLENSSELGMESNDKQIDRPRSRVHFQL